MKRIVTSLGVVVFVAAIVAGATGAFFSDTETSTANTFTAGAIDLTVDSQQHYNNAICVNGLWALEAGQTAQVDQYPVIGTICDGTWSLTDLGAQKFFNFADVKPGDSGENTVSLHINNNPAWACVNIKTTANEENGINNPESEASDTTSGVGQGELASNLKFQTWLDQGTTPGFQGKDAGEGDNIWQVGEPSLASGAMSDIVGNGLDLTLADGGTGTPISPTNTNYIGMFWCAGNVTGNYTVLISDVRNNTIEFILLN